MKLLELFSGTGVLSEHFRAHGHEAYTIDYNPDHKPDLCADISKITLNDIVELCHGFPDVIWASPDCTTYSVMAMGHHRTKNKETGELEPKSEYAKFCDMTNARVIDLIHTIAPTFYFIENPRGGLRKMRFMADEPRYTVTYCQYGMPYMKPTDIWTNHPDPQFKPPCKNGDPCHERAPRHCRSGLQGIDGKNKARDRARLPDQLCEHIVEICERYLD